MLLETNPQISHLPQTTKHWKTKVVDIFFIKDTLVPSFVYSFISNKEPTANRSMPLPLSQPNSSTPECAHLYTHAHTHPRSDEQADGYLKDIIQSC